MSVEMAFNLLWGVACALLGLLYKSTLSRLDRLDESIEKLADQMNHVVSDHPARSEIQADINRIERQIERILDKLDGKVDK